jgi:ABC-type transporter Mla subunit MlaD
MAGDELPPANLILQALHSIRGAVERTNDRLDHTINRLDGVVEALKQTNERLDKTIDRLDSLEKRTTKGFLDTNTRLAALTKAVAHQERRFEHLLTPDSAPRCASCGCA